MHLTTPLKLILAAICVGCGAAHSAASGLATNLPALIDWDSMQTNLFLTFDPQLKEGLAYYGPLILSRDDFLATARSPECWPAEKFPEGNWGEEVVGFRLSLRFIQKMARTGQPVVATVLLRNVSDKELSFPLVRIARVPGYGIFRENFEFVISGPEGKTLIGKPRDWDPYSKRWQVRRRTQRKLEIPISEEFHFEQPGEYRVQAKSLVHKPGGPGLIEITSGTATFQLVPARKNE